VPEVSPSPKTWLGIERRLFPNEQATSWWRRLPFWQSSSAFATIAAVTLAVLVARGPEVPPPVIIVLAPQPAADQAGLRSASFVASLGGDGRQLVVRPLDPEQARVVGRVFELWDVPPGAAPRSLGVLAEGRETALKVPSFFREASALAVSVEPPGGSPTGAPTGPVVAVGNISI
jgi:anti-sigma-K factor RskA